MTSLEKRLGKWALIDIETTGIDFGYDQIIDLGYLQFEGFELVREFESVVRPEIELPHFIQKLTGIRPENLRNAPSWDVVEKDLLDLEGHHLLAHNASFEENFLSPSFESLSEHGAEKERYWDSLPLFGLLYPGRTSLSLESLLIDLKIKENETHRGLEDSYDLLRALLFSFYLLHQKPERLMFLRSQVESFDEKDFWWKIWFDFEEEHLFQLSESIGFDLKEIEAKHEAHYREEKEEGKSISTGFSREFSGKNVGEIFQAEDEIRQAFPFYQFRSSQKELALRTGQSFKNKLHALIQAPTGTGKTLGYLVPSALFALENDEKILISTGTKTLQQQTLKKDLPALKQLLNLGDEFRAVRLIGSNNHFCELLFRREEDGGLLKEMDGFDGQYVQAFLETVFFENRTLRGPENKITSDDIPFILKKLVPQLDQELSQIKVDYRACLGTQCPFQNDCTYIQGLRDAKEAHVVVGNHSLMLQWPRSFPRPGFVVVDEAHKLEKEATEAYGLRLGQTELTLFLKNLAQSQGMGALFYLLGEDDRDNDVKELREETQHLYLSLKEHAQSLALQMESYFKKSSRYSSIYWNELPFVSRERMQDPLGVSVINHLESMKFVLSELGDMLAPFWASYSQKQMQEQERTAFGRFEVFYDQVDSMRRVLVTLFEDDEKFSRSFRYREDDGFELLCAPIDVGQMIHENLLEPSDSVVMTSATLCNEKGDSGSLAAEWMTGYRYLEPEKRFQQGLFLESPFDYTNRSNIFLCTDGPEMFREEYVPHIISTVTPLIRYLGGRTLFLFSSRVRFEKAREILLEKFDGEIPLFIQGMGNAVVEEFQKASHGILLGMESFGEGIDVPGEKLQLVIIDKVPDLRMDLIIQKRRDFFQQSFGNEFVDYYLSTRCRSLHQKLGRLIRRESDLGGAIIFDSRCRKWKGRTMGSFLKMMEPYALRVAPGEEAVQQLEDFFEGFNETKKKLPTETSLDSPQ